MPCVKKSLAVSFTILAAAGLLAGCKPPAPPVVGPTLPPEKVAVTGTLVPAAGLSASDYNFYDTVSPDAKALGADGAFTGESAGRRSGFLFAVPREGTATASKLAAGSGLYMSPAPGISRLVATGAGAATSYKLQESGNAAMDATTTVLSMLLLHPMAAHPWPGVQQQQARWLAEKASAGWPALQSAAQAYDAALLAQQDLATDGAFTAAFATCVADLADTMPEPQKPDPALATLESALSDSDILIAKTGVEQSTLTQQSLDATQVVFKPSTAAGTGLDYLCLVGDVPDNVVKMAGGLPDVGAISPYVKRPDTRYAAFMPAKSYFGYLNIVGNAMGWLKNGLLGAVFSAPGSAITLPATKVYEVRFFSGGYQGGNDASVYNFASQFYGEQTSNTFKHNVVMAVFEGLSLIPGSEAVMSDNSIGKAIAQKALEETVLQMDALTNAKPVDQVTSDDIYKVIYAVSKAAANELASKVTAAPRTAAYNRVIDWLSAGGQTVLKVVTSLPGKLAKGGALADRAASLVRPSSIMEYYAISAGFVTTGTTARFVNRGNGTIYDTLNKICWLKDDKCGGAVDWSSATAASSTRASGQCGLTDGSKAGDWRLPTEAELRTIVDAGYNSNTLTAVGFTVDYSDQFWSSTTYASDATRAWWMDSTPSLVMYASAKTASKYAWSVRAGQ